MSIRLPGAEDLVSEAILSALEGAGRRGLELAELVEELGGVRSEKEVGEQLGCLQAEGRVVRWARRWYALRFTDWRVGTVRVLAGGDALVTPSARDSPGFLVRRRDLAGARDGDLALLRPHRGKRSWRRGGLPRAVVKRVLRRALQRVVGTLEVGENRRWLIPFDPKVELEIEVEGGDTLMEDQYVVAEIAQGGRAAGGPLRGRVTEVLGSPAVPGVDVKVVLRHLEIPEPFPAAVEAEASALPADPGAADLADCEDLRAMTLVTIDGGQARDFDDAVGVERLAGGGFRLGVHIADVSHYVAEGSALDLEAYRRGTSVYFPDRAVPMFPESLSNGLCSLKPGVPRLTLSVFLDIAPDGEIRGRRFTRSVIRSARRLTYAEVRRLLEEPREADSGEYGAVLPVLFDARGLMRILHRARLARGSIDFDLPHGDVILDTDGYTVGVRPGERTVAHRVIEEFMIAANEAVAEEVESRGAPALYRIHEAPDGDSLEELREVLATFGVALKGDVADLGPRDLQKALRRVEGRPEEPFVSSLVLRSMKRALYHPEARGHYALGTAHYTHFTSPIRRYPDLLVHRQLKASLPGGDPAAARRALLGKRLPKIAEHSSTTERRAEAAERIILQWKMVRLLADRVGETFDGRITGVQPFGLFVQLVDWFVDGLVPIRTLEDDYYDFDAVHHRLVGASGGRTFRLADPLRVELTGVDHRRRGLELRLAGRVGGKPA